MLARILTDNPAHLFTKNFDSKFVSTVKDLLRDGRDTSVQQILRETLDYFEAEKVSGNETLSPLVEMWRKEKGKRNTIRSSVGWFSLEAVVSNTHTAQQQQYRVPPPFGGQRQQPSRRRDVLPPPEELVARIEEAKTTARLLVQTVQSTPQSELLANELVTEFAERARSAQKSIQSYLNCQNPAPDPDTTLTLIETNDHLNIAMSKHQRAVLQARKANGLATPSPQPEIEGAQNPPSLPQHSLGRNVYANINQPDHGSYSPPPPGPQNTLPSPVSPPRSEERFAPPPGPPPAARGAFQNQAPPTSYDYPNASAYSAPEQPPPIPNRVRPQSGGYSSTTAYDVSENPFADDAYGAAPPQPKRSNGLFDRSEETPSSQPPPLSGTQYVSELGGEPSRPGFSNANYQPTQSYMQRQDSSAAHITMHGGSPPPTQPGGAQAAGGHASDPAGPEDSEVGRQMNDLRL